MKEKLTSRKFWVAVASILGSIATAIAGLSIDNEIITIVGVICGVVSAGIYEIVEAILDCEDIDSQVDSDAGTIIYEKEDEQ